MTRRRQICLGSSDTDFGTQRDVPSRPALYLAVAAMMMALGLTSCVHLANPPGGFSTSTEGTVSSVAVVRLPPDPATRAALIRIAQEFNDNYDNGNFGAVWDRWDARGRALISRRGYIRRHEECAPETGVTARAEGAEKQPSGAWHVEYEIEHVQLVDTWHYVHHHWVLDIVKSNPQAARRYAMPFGEYAAAVGCSVH